MTLIAFTSGWLRAVTLTFEANDESLDGQSTDGGQRLSGVG